MRDTYSAAFQTEADERRLFLWVPVCAGAGAILYLCAEREPWLPLVAGLAGLTCVLAVLLRRHVAAYRVAIVAAAIFAGMMCGALRTHRLTAPVLDRIRISKLTGFLEEVDHRREGARFILRITSAADIEPDRVPYRVRLTTRRAMDLEAGSHVSLTARLVPPARAALPGGYDFGRDAYFARLGAVGNALGRIQSVPAQVSADFSLRFYATVDRARNALARRVERAIGGPAGAVGAAMVTGKRDFLDDPTREVIREAGIFHIITIAGVQMTLVAAIFFSGLRRLLALSPTLALHYPIKKSAAALAMIGAIAYDIGTGSRVGTERALYMTLIVLGAVICDRQAFSMRNLALAALMVVVFEPEALLGASFQLSFAAVAALIAIWEVRLAAFASRARREDMPLRAIMVDRNDKLLEFIERTRHGPGAMLTSTVCATAATASFMAYHFHELSPYVLIGNPLTLAIIEFFAVPGALLGTLLYPLGLDGWVWSYVGLGIHLVLWAASWIGAMPGATIHLREFAPPAIILLSLAVLCAVLWRTLAMRLLALPLLAGGLAFAASAPPQDLFVAPTGDAVALRNVEGQLAVFGRRPSPFLVEQWLRADADGRPAREAIVAVSQTSRGPQRTAAGAQATRCDPIGCVSPLANGRTLALTLERAGFAEDCSRAAILVTPLDAPAGCGAELVIDRGRLAATGALAIRFGELGVTMRSVRAPVVDRPWSPAPRREIARAENGAPLPRPVTGRENLSELAVDETPPFR